MSQDIPLLEKIRDEANAVASLVISTMTGYVPGDLNGIDRNFATKVVSDAIYSYATKLNAFEKGASSSVNGGVWETFYDASYYGMWAVRPVGDKDFNSQLLFHVPTQGEAERLKEIIESRPSIPKDNEGDKEKAEEYANKIVPNSDKNDAPYFTSSDRWQDNKDAILAGCQSKETTITENHFSDTLDSIIKGQLEKARERVKELEEALHKIVVKQYPGGETEAPYWVDYAISIAQQALAGK